MQHLTPTRVASLTTLVDARCAIVDRRLRDTMLASYESNLAGAALTLHDAYPDAVTMVLANDDEGGIAYSVVDADGTVHEADYSDKATLVDDLWKYSCSIDMGRPYLLKVFAKGSTPAPDDVIDGEITTEEIGSHLHVDEMHVDIEAIIGRIMAPHYPTPCA